MKLRLFRLLFSVLLSSSVLSCALAACGGDDVGPPEIDASAADAAAEAGLDGGVDAGPIDAGGCRDDDGDGHGAAPCGDDCDDTRNAVNPNAAEVCNAGSDDDCNGLADAADGVCVRCGTGYTGLDGDCIDIDECATGGVCGTGSTACTNLAGTFACTCAPGYGTAAATGALCQNIDECAEAANPCGAGACVDNAGSYVCICPAGYRLAASPTLTCVDVDECAEGADLCTDVPAAACVNTAGSYACTCPAGYEGSGRGAGGCLWNDPSLASLIGGVGASLSPVFSPGTTTYVLTLPPGETSTTLTPTVAQPTGATINADGSALASGASAIVSVAGFRPHVIEVVVTTETSAIRTYSVAVVRSSTYVKASNTEAIDQFGYSVSLSADGTRLAVGAFYEDSSATGIDGNQTDNGASASGAVYVFARTASTWTQEAYVKPSNTRVFGNFGISVSLSADGTRLAVGSWYESSSATGINGNQADTAAGASGAVYVFSRTGTTWTQEAYVKASNTGASDYFGYSVSLSSDGTRLAVGAYGENSSATGIGGNQADNTALDSGAVYLFSRSGTTWTQEAYVKASNTEVRDNFGMSVSLSADGARLAVGAYGEDSNATGIGGNQADNTASNGGAVYVFSRTDTTWTQEAYVKASNTGASDNFGNVMSLSADGTRLAVGAPNESSRATGVDGDQADNSALYAGAVYLFSRSGAVWVQEAYVKASNAWANDFFGSSVSLSADGARLAAGALFESSSATGINGNQADDTVGSSGAVYVLSRTGTTWSQEAYVKASNTDAADVFHMVSLSADGTRLAVGARNESSGATGIDGNQADNSATNSGAVYVF